MAAVGIKGLFHLFMFIPLPPILASSILPSYFITPTVKKEKEVAIADIVKTGLPVVLKFLKFHRCPEIRNCSEILLIWSECPEINLCYAVVTALP